MFGSRKALLKQSSYTARGESVPGPYTLGTRPQDGMPGNGDRVQVSFTCSLACPAASLNADDLTGISRASLSNWLRRLLCLLPPLTGRQLKLHWQKPRCGRMRQQRYCIPQAKTICRIHPNSNSISTSCGNVLHSPLAQCDCTSLVS